MKNLIIFLRSLCGLKLTDYDSCVHTTTDDNLQIAQYVDDALVIEKLMATIKCLLNKLKDKFEITIPPDNYYLKLEIERDRQNRNNQKCINQRIQEMYSSVLKWIQSFK